MVSSRSSRRVALVRPPPGVTRTSYGDGENFAHRLIAEWAEELSLEVLGGLLDDTFCPTEE